MKEIVGAFRSLDPEHVVAGDDRGLPDVEWAKRGDHGERACDIGLVALGRLVAAEDAFGN